MISTTLANGESALDMTWFRNNPAAMPSLYPVFRFDKTIKVSNESNIYNVLAKYPTIFGYVIRENNVKANVILSKTGHSDYYDLYVTKDWVMLLYKGAGSKNTVYVQEGATLKFSFKLLTPCGYMASPMAKIVGSPALSYLISNGNLYETFGGADVSMLDADYQIYSGMSLVAAFNVRAGSFGLSYFPASNRQGLNLFFNKELGRRSFSDLPKGWGIYFTSTKRSNAEDVIRSIQNGLPIHSPEWCQVYPLPDTAARSTAALPSFVCRFSGVKPVKEQGGGDLVDVVYDEVIFDSPLLGEGIQAWVNGAPVWECAQYYITSLADVEGMVADYQEFMKGKLAAATSAISNSVNTAAKELDSILNRVYNLEVNEVTLTRDAIKEFVSVGYDSDKAIGYLTDDVRIRFGLPLKQLFPAVDSVVNIESLSNVGSSISENMPRIAPYLKLLKIKIVNGDGTSNVYGWGEVPDTTPGAVSAEILVDGDAYATLEEYIRGSDASLVKQIVDQMKVELAEVLNARANSNKTGVKFTDDAMIQHYYTYGCDGKVLAYEGYWANAGDMDVNTTKFDGTTGPGNTVAADSFKVNHGKTSEFNYYYEILRAHGMDPNSQTHAKFWDFAVKSITLTDCCLLRGVLSPNCQIEIEVDDFTFEQLARDVDKLQCKRIIEAIWSTSGFQAFEQGDGNFTIPSEKRSVKTGACFWDCTEFAGIPIGGRDGEVVCNSLRLHVRKSASVTRIPAIINGAANKFTGSYTVFDKLASKIVASINAEGVAYLLRRLAAYGDLKNCKMLVESDDTYLKPEFARFFTALSLDEAGATAIDTAVNALLMERQKNANGTDSKDYVIQDEEMRNSLRELASDFKTLTLKQSEEKPWFNRSSAIKTRAGRYNPSALGLYLYL